jgi:molecular chaperone DnaK (HSP70)
MANPAKFLVGIDLGTSHTVVAYTDAHGENPIKVFPIKQVISETASAPRELLPSCLYGRLEHETIPDAFPELDDDWIGGEQGQRRGAEVPGRLVASAKSWLCHPGVDRQAAILPWDSRSANGTEEQFDNVPEPSQPKISPVDASARYLRHVRAAWNMQYPLARLHEQNVILTVPASFDEAAREYTLEATRQVGLSSVVLLEEPQAAVYDWMNERGIRDLRSLIPRGEEHAYLLVVDIGGGTTDLSLLRITGSKYNIEIERVAVGDHLLLGGDNMDLAIAYQAEKQLSTKLDAAQFGQLVQACRGAKEKLLGPNPQEQETITILGRGSKLFGNMLRFTLQRTEVEELVLQGFFPHVDLGEQPRRSRSALVGFGLPYAQDPAITRHITWFLARYAQGVPIHAVLLNGGVFRASRLAHHLGDVVNHWSKEIVPKVLIQDEPDLAVARGAVMYGLAREGQGLRIRSGTARAYYVGVESSGEQSLGLCVVPQGAEVAQLHRADRELSLRLGRPVRFDLLVSTQATNDQPGDVVVMDEENFLRLPPIATTIPTKENHPANVDVLIEGELSEIGTLELYCVEKKDTNQRHRLAFSLRPSHITMTPGPPSVMVPTKRVHHTRLDEAETLIKRVYGKSKEEVPAREVKDLLRNLEKLLGERATWNTETTRHLFDSLMSKGKGRRRTADHERLFFLLVGYCLRPGFGVVRDQERVSALFPMFSQGLTHRESRVWAQLFIAFRRIAGGLSETMQVQIRDYVDRHLVPPLPHAGKPRGAKPEALDEMFALATHLERVPAVKREQLGNWVVERMWTQPELRWRDALGRIGARVPSYASVHYVVSPKSAETWLDELMREPWTPQSPHVLAAVRLARKTGDRARDISESAQDKVLKRLEELQVNPSWLAMVRDVVEVSESETIDMFGESLPVGLRFTGKL